MEKLTVHGKVNSLTLFYFPILLKTTNVTLSSPNKPEYAHYVSFWCCVQVQKCLKKTCKKTQTHQSTSKMHLPSLRLSLANPGLWLLDSSDELLNDDWGKADTNWSSQLSASEKYHIQVNTMNTTYWNCNETEH